MTTIQTPPPAPAPDKPHKPRYRLLNVMSEVASAVLYRLWRSVSWVFRSKWRLLIFAWLSGFFFVGQAQLASADDGLISGPDLGSAGGQTVFERFGPEKFTFNVQLSDSHHGGLGIEEGMWTILQAIENGLMYLIAALARGAITSMEWMLNLTLYSDNAGAIDSAVQQVANQVFWPLFGTTMAIGAMVAYGRMKREGNGSLWNDASWLIAASVLAATFVTAPSLVLKDMDNTRSSLGSALMVGYSHVAPVGQSAAGFPPVSLPTDQPGATRALADGMWNVFVVTPWCYGNFNSLDICKDVGKDYLTQDSRWQGLVHWMGADAGTGGNKDDTNGQAYCPPELNAQCDWIRGQSFGRLGAVLFVLVVTLPLVALLLALVLFGLMAIIGFLLIALSGVLFLLFWMIPGRPRQIGVRWLEELIGALFQSLIITTVIGAVMVVDSFLSAGIPKYGFFVVALLNLATFVTGFRLRGRLENVVGMGAGGGSSPFSGYMAMRAMGAVGKNVGRAGKRTAELGVSAAKGSYRGGQSLVEGMRDSSPLMGGAVTDVGQRMQTGGGRVLAPLRTRTAPTDPKAGTGAAGTGGAGTGGAGAGGVAAATAGAVADRPPRQSGGVGVTRPAGGSGPGSSGPARGGAARPARHRGDEDNPTPGTPPMHAGFASGGGDSGGSGNAGPGSANGRAGSAAVDAESSPSIAGGGGSGRDASRTAAVGSGAAVAATSGGGATGKRQRRAGTAGSRTASPGGARGGGQHFSPPVRSGPAPAIRTGQPPAPAPARELRPLQSRPAPANPKGNLGQPSTPAAGSSSGGNSARPAPHRPAAQNRVAPAPRTTPQNPGVTPAHRPDPADRPQVGYRPALRPGLRPPPPPPPVQPRALRLPRFLRSPRIDGDGQGGRR